MFGLVNKLKSLLGIQKDVVEDAVEELIDKGVEAEVVDDDSFEIETEGKSIDEVLDDIQDTWVEPRDDEEDDDDEDDDVGVGGGRSYIIYLYRYKTRDDQRRCPDCSSFAEIYTWDLELNIDSGGSLHAGGDDDIVKFLLKDSDVTFEELIKNPTQSIQPLQLHVDKDPQYGYNTCRCKLLYIKQR